MKNFLSVLFCLLLSMPGMAQDFYSSNDIEISWKYWDDDNGWEWLINNGTKIPCSCETTARPIRINYFYQKDNKFLIFTFRLNNWITLETENDFGTNFSELFPTISYVMGMDWFKIDFDHIVYDATWNRIMIPCGIDERGAHNAICIDFNTTDSSVENVKKDTKEAIPEYYNLQGRKVNIDDEKGQILIKKEGSSTIKFLNK